MPIHDFRCTECENVHDELVKMDVKVHSCPECHATSQLVFLTPPKIDWGRMGAQANVSPEFIDRFEKVHREEAIREKKLNSD